MEWWNDGIMGSEKHWNAGMMEFWNNGLKKLTTRTFIAIFHSPIFFVFPIIPTFHYSFIYFSA